MYRSRISYNEKLRLHYIVVDANVLQSFATPKDKSIYNQRFNVIVNDTIQWEGGTVSLGNNKAYITISKDRMKKLGVSKGDTVEFSLTKNNSKYGFEVPQEFEALLEQDPVGKSRFESLTMGAQRAVIYIVKQLKSSDKRIEKSIFLIENLKKAPVGKETMRHILGKDLP